MKGNLRQLAVLSLPLIVMSWTEPAMSETDAYRREVNHTADKLYPELFEAVQNRHLLGDQKAFLDMVPRQSPEEINRQYREASTRTGFDLKAFVDEHFARETIPDIRLKDTTSMSDHIDKLWPLLVRDFSTVDTKGSAIRLPHPSLVPGGRFNELFYWDSYFSMLGLSASGRQNISTDMLKNFAYLIDTYGHIPNGTRTYFLTRSQPPFFAMMVEAEAKAHGDQVYREYLPQLKKEYAFWMDGAADLPRGKARKRVVRLRDGTLLNRYWDASDQPRQEAWAHDIKTAQDAKGRKPEQVYRDLRAAAESGWDFSGRWSDHPQSLSSIRTTSIIPVDLNSLLYQLEVTLAKACSLSAGACNVDYATAAVQRKRAINHYLWNQDGFYADYDRLRGKIRSTLTAATLFPLFNGVATQAQADKTAATVDRRLVREGGLVTTESTTGQQWDSPNGWAPLNWVAVEGLDRYGHKALAQKVGTRFLKSVSDYFDTTHTLMEKYDVVKGKEKAGGGEYHNQEGFGWTNAVTLLLMQRYQGDMPSK